MIRSMFAYMYFRHVIRSRPLFVEPVISPMTHFHQPRTERMSPAQSSFETSSVTA